MPLEITIPLDIPDVRLLWTEITDSGQILVGVESTLEGATCHRQDQAQLERFFARPRAAKLAANGSPSSAGVVEPATECGAPFAAASKSPDSRLGRSASFVNAMRNVAWS